MDPKRWSRILESRWVPLLAGVLLGLASRYSSSLPEAFRWAGNFGASWLVVAFLVGRSRTSVKVGAASGALALAVAVAAHYVPYRLTRFGLTGDVVKHPLVLWMIVAGIAGALFGHLGIGHRLGSEVLRVWTAATVVSALAAEAVILFVLAPDAAKFVAVPLEMGTAIALPFFLVRSSRGRLVTYLAAIGLLPMFLVGLTLMVATIGRVYPTL